MRECTASLWMKKREYSSACFELSTEPNAYKTAAKHTSHIYVYLSEVAFLANILSIKPYANLEMENSGKIAPQFQYINKVNIGNYADADTLCYSETQLCICSRECECWSCYCTQLSNSIKILKKEDK